MKPAANAGQISSKRIAGRWEVAVALFLAFALIFEPANVSAWARSLDEESPATEEAFDPPADSQDEAPPVEPAPEPAAEEPAAPAAAAPSDATADVQVALTLGDSRIVAYPDSERESAAAAPTATLTATASEVDVLVTVRFYDENNQIASYETNVPIPSGNLTEASAGVKPGYEYMNATVSDSALTPGTVVSYARAYSDGSVFFSPDANPITGMSLRDDEAIYLNYKAIGNRVRVSYTTSGYDAVEGNEVLGFPSTVERSVPFGFQVVHSRGYSVVVTANGSAISPASTSTGASTYSMTVDSDTVVNIEFRKTTSVTFDSGIFHTTDQHVYGRFTTNSPNVQTQAVGSSGASFTYTFTTNSGYNWMLNSLQINDIALALPQTRAVNATASNVLYSDATGQCVVTVTVTNRSGSRTTYRISVTGAREDLTITNANLNNVGWKEVVPTATEGINFESSPTANGTFEEGGLNTPFATDASISTYRPKFRFSLQDGYKNLTATFTAYDENSALLATRAVSLPISSATNVTLNGATVARITNSNGVYTVQYNNASSYGNSGIVYQFLELSAERSTYSVAYDPAEGTGAIADNETYDAVDNTLAVVSSSIPTAPAGKFFIGWKIQGDATDAIYYAGDSIDFTNREVLALLQQGQNDGVIRLVAQYANTLQYGATVPVTVKYLFEQENADGTYSYAEDESRRTSVTGVTGNTLTMLQHAATVEKNGVSYTYSSANSTDTVVVDGAACIELSYGMPALEVSADSTEVVYDAQGHYLANVQHAAGSILEYKVGDGEWTQTAPCAINVNDSLNGTISVRARKDGYKTAIQDGLSIVVTRRAVTITSDTATKPFDGQPLTAHASSATGGLFVEGQGYEASYAGTQTYVGTSDNAFAIALVGGATADNYDVTTVPGTLTVTSADIADEARFDVSQPDDRVYSGLEQAEPPVVRDAVTGEVLSKGTDYDESFSPDVTNVGTVTVTIVAKGNYSGTVERIYAITTARLVITVNDAGKVVGATDPQFTGEVSGLLGGDTLAVSYYRSNAAEGIGRYADVLLARYADDANYTVDVVPGTFTISPKPVAPPDEPSIQTAVAATSDDRPSFELVGGIADGASVPSAAQPTPNTSGGPDTADGPDAVDTPADADVGCWVHTYIIFGMVVTLIYGVGVVARRKRFADKLAGYEDDLTRGNEDNE